MGLKTLIFLLEGLNFMVKLSFSAKLLFSVIIFFSDFSDSRLALN